MKITKTKLPQNSILLQKGSNYHYTDSYNGNLLTERPIYSTDLTKAFFNSAPDWVEKLFSIRNKVVKLVGLKTAPDLKNKKRLLENFSGQPGEQIGLFKILEKTDKEVILGEDDKHLNFRVSLLIHPNGNGSKKKELTISTAVVFNNWLGRLYFLPVRPFHRHIVPSMLKGMIRELEKEVE